MTINKLQRQTFDRVGINLRKDVFNHEILSFHAFVLGNIKSLSWQSAR